MTDQPAPECKAKFLGALPAGGVDATQSIADYRDIVKAIEENAKSTLFISSSDAYSAFTDELEANGKEDGNTVFANGIKAHVRQKDGLPNLLILEEPETDKKETVKMNETSGLIEFDKVEYCGISRERHFESGRETYRAYGFPGGIIDTDDKGHPRFNKVPVEASP